MSPAHIGNDGYQGVKTVMPRENRLTAKVYLSNTMAGNTGSSSVGGTYVNSMPSSDPVNVGSTIPQSTSYREEIHHRQPIRLGVSLHYRLNDRWGIESGLSYTRLLSDITIKSATQTTHIEQKLSYIGLPVNITYRLWNNRRFSCYLSAGVMAEMMITGSRTSEGKEENIKNQPLQFSINGAAGAEYQLGNVLGLFAEPGLSYHFKNSSDIPTFYQENPLGFNLNLGIRFYLNRHNTAR
jgi:outer membrane protein W